MAGSLDLPGMLAALTPQQPMSRDPLTALANAADVARVRMAAFRPAPPTVEPVVRDQRRGA